MGLDRVDAVAVAGILGLVAGAARVETIVVAAALGGLLLAVAVRRLYGGRPWEAAGWLAWVGAAIATVVGAGDPLASTAAVGAGLLGGAVLISARLGTLSG